MTLLRQPSMGVATCIRKLLRFSLSPPPTCTSVSCIWRRRAVRCAMAAAASASAAASSR